MVNMGKWTVRTLYGYAGGTKRDAKATLEIETLADTLEEIRIRVEALPDLIAACQLFRQAWGIKTHDGKLVPCITCKGRNLATWQAADLALRKAGIED